MNDDRELEERLRRLSWPVDRGRGWAGIEALAKKQERTTDAGRPAAARVAEQPADSRKASAWNVIRPRKRSRRSIAVYVSLAVLLMAGMAVGAVEVARHLGQGQPVIAIGDDTGGMSPGSKEQASQTTQATTVSTTNSPTTYPTTSAVASADVWQELALPRSGYPVCFQLVMDPADPKVLYAATDAGLFVSRDGAASWVQAEGFGSHIDDILVDPGPPTAVYIGFAGEDGKLHFKRTMDRGVTWQELPAVTNRMLVATFGSVLYARDFSENASGGDLLLIRSSDGGNSWEELTLPPYVGTEAYVLSLERDPRNPSRLYLYSPAMQSLRNNFVRSDGIRVHVYASDDGGRTWSDVKGDELDWAKAVGAAAPGATADAVAGASALLEAAWQPEEYGMNASTGGPFALSQVSTLIAVDPGDPSILYVGTSAGIYKSVDAGNTWSNEADTMATTPKVQSMVVDPLTLGIIYLTSENGIFKSTDDGRSWASLSQAGVALSSLAIAPSSPSTLYAWGDLGLSQSNDGGATWAARAGVGLPSSEPGQRAIWELLISSESPDILLASTVGGIFRSTDGGDVWARPTGLPEAARGDEELTFGDRLHEPRLLFQACSDPSVFYAVLADRSSGFSLALFTSTDGGETWTLLTNLGNADAAYLPLAIDTSDPLTIYAQLASFTFLPDGHIDGVSTDAVFRRSSDGGHSWTEISTEGPGEFFNLYVDEWTGSTLYALTKATGSERSVYCSADKGQSWKELCRAPNVGSLIPAPGGTLYGVGERTVHELRPSAR